MVAQLEDGSLTYGYAASGRDDIEISFEEPIPIAQYQALGTDPILPAPEGVYLEAFWNEETEKYDVKIMQDIEDSEPVELTADSYFWQSYNFALERWNEVEGMKEQVFPLASEALDVEDENYENDFRCIYTIGEERFATATLIYGYEYDPEDDAAKEVPEDIEKDPEPEYTKIDFENEFESSTFELTFAEDEWVKTIIVKAIDDEIKELDEVALFTITGCYGGTYSTICNSLALGIKDNEPMGKSEINFEAGEVLFDQDDGEAVVTLVRTGDTGYPVSVKYETEDGTAVAGKQYTKVSEEVSLMGDIDTVSIKVPLIAEEMRKGIKTFKVKITEVKGGGTEEACKAGKTDTVTVALTSSGNAVNSGQLNLASFASRANGIDSSAKITESKEALVRNDTEIEAEPNIYKTAAGRSLTGIYVNTNTYDYPALQFSRDSNYLNQQFWVDEEAVFGNNKNCKVGYHEDAISPVFSTACHDLGDKGRNYYSCDPGRLTVGHDATTTEPAKLNIENAGYLFSKVSWEAHLDYDAVLRYDDGWKKQSHYRYIQPWITMQGGGFDWSTNFGPHYFGKKDWPYDGEQKTQTVKNQAIDFSADPFNMSLKLVCHYNGNQGPEQTCDSYTNASGKASIKSLVFTRRKFDATSIGLRIFTANDADAAGEYTVLDPNSAVYDVLKPEVSIVNGMGGVDTKGHLYAGTQLLIQVAKSAAYLPLTAETVQQTLFLTDSEGNKYFPKVEKADDGDNNECSSFYLTLLWDNMELSDLSKTYTINFVYNRQQTIEVDLSPSLPRDSNGKQMYDEKSLQKAYDNFIFDSDGLERRITYTSSVYDENKDSYFTQKILTLPASSLIKQGSSLLLDPRISPNSDNIQKINFGLDPEDIILFGGQEYAGNKDIILTLQDLSPGIVTFRFYDREYQDEVSDCNVLISHTELFYDADGNGKIDGYFDEETGYFIVDAKSRDYSLGMITEDFNEEKILPTIDPDGTVHQYFLKTYYTVTPKALKKLNNDLLQVLPAFVSGVTDEATLAGMTEEEKSYRVIQASGTFVVPFDREKGEKGNKQEIKDTSEDHALYGAAASKLSTLDMPLGGNTRSYVGALVGEEGNQKPLNCTDFHGNLRVPYTGDALKNLPDFTISNDGGENYLVQDKNGYLGAFTGISTFTVNTQVQREIKTLADIVPESIAMGTFKTQLEPIDMSNMLDEPQKNDEFDTGNSMPTADIAGDMNLPALSFGLSSYFDVTNYDGNKMLISVGIPVAQYTYSKSSSGKTEESEDGSTKDTAHYVDSDGETIEKNVTKTKVFDEEGAKLIGEKVTTEYHKDLNPESLKKNGEFTEEHHYKYVEASGTVHYENITVRHWIDKDGNAHNETIKDYNPYKQSKGSWSSPISGQAKETISAVKGMDFSKLFGNEYPSNHQKAKDTGDKHFRNFAISFTVKFALTLEYDQIAGIWNATNLAIQLVASVFFKYEYRFAVVAYLFVKVTFTVTFSANASFPLKKEEGTLLESVAVSGLCGKIAEGGTVEPGKWAVFKMNAKDKLGATTLNGIRLMMDGKVNMYISEDPEVFKNVDSDGNKKKIIAKGTLNGDGQAPTDVRFKYDGDADYLYAGFFVRENSDPAVFDDTKELFIVGHTFDYNYTGINLDFLFQGGIGADPLPGLCVELYFKANANVLFQLGGTNLADNSRNSDMTYLALIAAVGIDITAWIFHYSMDLIGYYYYLTKAYPGAEAQVDKGWKAVGQLYPIGDDDNANEADDLVGIHTSVPANTARSQRLFSTAESNAFDPEDKSVPFQFSGYGASGTAFKLTDKMDSAYTYKAVEAGGESYIVYPIAVEGPKNDADAVQLVLSKVISYGETQGLENPADPESKTPYIVVDNHKTPSENTGDIEFDVTSSGDNIIVVWTTYEKQLKEGVSDLSELGKNMVVKKASFNVNGGTAFTGHQVISEAAGKARSLPVACDGASFYPEMTSYGGNQQELSDLRDYMKKAKGFSDSELDNMETTPDKAQLLMWYQTAVNAAKMNGNSTELVAVTENGGKTTRTAVDISGEQGESIGAVSATKTDDGYLVAYTTRSTAYFDESGKTTSNFDGNTHYCTVKRMYVRNFSNGKWGTAYLYRTYFDFEDCNKNTFDIIPDSVRDGLYSGSSLITQQDGKAIIDPAFQSLKFIRAAIDDKSGIQNLLVFMVNGKTYAVTEDDVNSLVSGGGANPILLFDEEAALDTTLGADSLGNMMLLYTRSVEGSTGNALYVSWWDKNLGKWGDESILAMNHLQVEEDKDKYNLTGQELEKAFLGEKTGNEEYDNYISELDKKTPEGEKNTSKGAMDQVTFSNLDILAVNRPKDDEEEEDCTGLIAFAQGLKTGLKRVSETTDQGQSYDQLLADGEGFEQGFYCIAFGTGEQSISGEYVNIDSECFTAGSSITGKVGFANTGTAAIRGSEANPIIVELKAIAAQDDYIQTLGSWQIKENIPSGAKVDFNFGSAPLTQNLTEGTKIVLSVSEDTNYIEDAYGKVSEPLYTVGGGYELGIENAEFKFVSADEKNAYYDFSMQVTNRGEAKAYDLHMQFTSEDEDGHNVPLNITGSSFIVERQTPINLINGAGGNDYANGVVALVDEDGDSSLKAGYARNITGRLCVKKSAYQKESLPVKLEVYSRDDKVSRVNSDVQIEHTEGFDGNAWLSTCLNQETIFAQPSSITMKSGATLIMNCPFMSTAVTSDVSVREISDGSENWKPVLNSISFVNGEIRAVATLSGNTVIQIEDKATNSFVQVPLIVKDEVSALNVAESNQDLAFGGKWTYKSNVTYWAGEKNKAPLDNDIMVSNADNASFNFTTSAEGILVYHTGDIDIKSGEFGIVDTEKGNGYTKVTFNNYSYYMHTVTITAPKIGIQIDRYELFYDDYTLRNQAKDKYPPEIIYDRSLPKSGTIKNGDVCPIGIYITDDHPILSVNVEGLNVIERHRLRDELIYIEANVSQNGTLSVTAMDINGNARSESCIVDWFTSGTASGLPNWPNAADKEKLENVFVPVRARGQVLELEPSGYSEIPQPWLYFTEYGTKDNQKTQNIAFSYLDHAWLTEGKGFISEDILESDHVLYRNGIWKVDLYNGQIKDDNRITVLKYTDNWYKTEAENKITQTGTTFDIVVEGQRPMAGVEKIYVYRPEQGEIDLEYVKLGRPLEFIMDYRVNAPISVQPTSVIGDQKLGSYSFKNPESLSFDFPWNEIVTEQDAKTGLHTITVPIDRVIDFKFDDNIVCTLRGQDSYEKSYTWENAGYINSSLLHEPFVFSDLPNGEYYIDIYTEKNGGKTITSPEICLGPKLTGDIRIDSAYSDDGKNVTLTAIAEKTNNTGKLKYKWETGSTEEYDYSYDNTITLPVDDMLVNVYVQGEKEAGTLSADIEIKKADDWLKYIQNAIDRASDNIATTINVPSDIIGETTITKLTIPEKKNIILNLDGHTLKYTGDPDGMFDVYGKLTVTDNSKGKGRIVGNAGNNLEKNGFHVNKGASLVLNGITVQNIYGTTGGEPVYGCAIHNEGGTVEVRDSVIKDNGSYGIYSAYGEGKVVVIGSSFIGNAGGIYVNGDDLTVKESIFDNNSSDDSYIGVIYADGTNVNQKVIIKDSAITNNNILSSASVIQIRGEGNNEMTGCTVTENTAKSSSIMKVTSSLLMKDCTITGNKAPDGAVYLNTGSRLAVDGKVVIDENNGIDVYLPDVKEDSEPITVNRGLFDSVINVYTNSLLASDENKQITFAALPDVTGEWEENFKVSSKFKEVGIDAEIVKEGQTLVLQNELNADQLLDKLQEAINKASDNVQTTIVVPKNIIGVTTLGKLTIPEKKNIVLDLNGHTLKYKKSGTGRLIDVFGKLTVIDSAEEKGCIAGFEREIRHAIYINPGAYLITDGITIQDIYGFITAGDAKGCAIYNENGTAEVRNTIFNNDLGYGIYSASGEGKVTVTGSSFTENAGGIYVKNDDLTVEKSTFDHNSSNETNYNGTICAEGTNVNQKVIIKDSTFTNNSSLNTSAVIGLFGKGNNEMTGCTITGNTAKSGSIVRLAYSVQMKDCTITGNTAPRGAVLLGSDALLTLDGEMVIDENDGLGVYIPETQAGDKPMTVNKGLHDSVINICADTILKDKDPEPILFAILPDATGVWEKNFKVSSKFKEAGIDAEIVKDGQTLVLQKKLDADKLLNDIQEAVNKASDNVQTTIVVPKNIIGVTTLGKLTIPEKKNIVLDLNGHTLKYGNVNSGCLIEVNGELKVIDSSSGNGTIAGMADNKCNSCGILVNNGAVLNMEGGTIQDCYSNAKQQFEPKADKSGTAIYNMNGIVNLKNVTIKDNSYYGLFSISRTGKDSVTVKDSVISGNYGGIYVNGNDLSADNVTFRDNANDYNGAGIYIVDKNNKISVTNSEFSGNAVRDGVAAIYYTGNGTPVISGCTFTKNKSYSCIVNLEDGALFKDCTFTDNDSDCDIVIGEGTVTFDGKIIAGEVEIGEFMEANSQIIVSKGLHDSEIGIYSEYLLNGMNDDSYAFASLPDASGEWEKNFKLSPWLKEDGIDAEIVREGQTLVLQKKLDSDQLLNIVQNKINEAPDNVQTTIVVPRNIIGVTTLGKLTIPKNKDIVLDLNGHTLKYKKSGTGRLVDVFGKLTVIDSGKEKGCIAGYEREIRHAIYVNPGASLITDGITIQDVWGFIVAAGIDGCAIYNENGTVEVRNTIFKNDSGYGIHSASGKGKVTVTGSSFTGNAGGIYVKNDDLTVDKSTFDNNSSDVFQYKGVICAEGTNVNQKVIIKDSTFTNNNILNSASVIQLLGKGNNEMTGCTITGNTAKSSGIMFISTSALIKDCTITGNTAPRGAVLLGSDALLTLDGEMVFDDNDGLGIYIPETQAGDKPMTVNKGLHDSVINICADTILKDEDPEPILFAILPDATGEWEKNFKVSSKFKEAGINAVIVRNGKTLLLQTPRIMIEGTPIAGQKLTLVNMPADTSGLTYTWYRVTGSEEQVIEGADKAFYNTVNEDIGAMIKCKISKASGTFEITDAVGPVHGITLEGTPYVGDLLKITGAETGNVQSYSWTGRDPQTGKTYLISANNMYTTVAKDLGMEIYCDVTLKSGETARTNTVGPLKLPKNRVYVTGTEKVGSTLTANVDTDYGTPIYTWYRVVTWGPEIAIEGATGNTYVLTDQDVNNFIRCDVSFKESTTVLKSNKFGPIKKNSSMNTARTTAIRQIREAMGSDPSDAVKKIAEEAFAAISAESDPDKIFEISDKALEDIFNQRNAENLPRYEIIESVDIYYLSKESDAVFVSSAPFLKLVEVRVDKKTVDPSNFDAEEGSTKITIHSDFMKTLSEGTHSIEIVSEDGIASTVFAVFEVPQTADNVNVLIYIVLMLSCLAAIFTALCIKMSGRKKER